MNYRDLLQRLSTEYNAGEARAVLKMLLEDAFSLRWTDVLCGGLDSLPAEKLSALQEMMCRLEQGEPIQYVLGEACFMGRNFIVAPGVLIPRPETELLVEEAMKVVHGYEERKGRVLDICTGSGCIAISMAAALPNCDVEAWDISDEALSIAKRNAERFKTDNVVLKKVDALSEEIPSAEYSLIVSNPPYVLEKEREDMDCHVLDYEPSLALFVPDNDPLRFYKRITKYASENLSKDGYLLFEINRDYGEEVAELLRGNGFKDVSIIKDQFSNDRVVRGKK